MVVVKDNLGVTVSPDTFTLAQSVLSMTIDMPQHVRDNVELAVKQAMESPEDFIRYVIIVLGDYRQQLDAVVGALVHEGILTVEENDDALSS